MAIFRGNGGASDATDQATNQAVIAQQYAAQAAVSASNAATTLTNFNNVYLGTKSVAPTVDNSGTPLNEGDLYYNSAFGRLQVYTNIGWADTAVATASTFVLDTFSGTGVQTNFTLSITPAEIQSVLVFVSGIKLRPTTDYTFSGTTLTFIVSPASGTNNISVTTIRAMATGVPDDNSISTAKIQNGAVTDSKLSTGLNANKLTGDASIASITTSANASVGGTLSVMGNTTLSNTLTANASVGTAGQVLASGGTGVAPSWTTPIATAITNTPAGNIAATNVQAAINELDTKKAKVGALATSGITGAAASGANSDITSLSALTSINSGQIAGFRNRFINGGFNVSQRPTLAAVTASATYFADRWMVQYAGGTSPSLIAGSGLSAAFSSGFNGYVYGTFNGNNILVQQRIESYQCSDLVNKTVTVSAKFYQDTGSTITVTPSANYATVKDTFSTIGAIATGSAVSIPSGVTTTISWTFNAGANASLGIQIVFSSSVMTGVTKNYDFSEFQLEVGSVATPFEQRPYGLELSLCQRYLPVVNTSSFLVGQCASTTTGFASAQFKVPARVAPTGITLLSAVGASSVTNSTTGVVTLTALTFNSASIDNSLLAFSVASGLVAGNATLLNSTTQVILFTGCEL